MLGVESVDLEGVIKCTRKRRERTGQEVGGGRFRRRVSIVYELSIGR